MMLQVVYCNHESAPLAVRERLAFPSRDVIANAVTSLRSEYPETDTVILSTCNRVEIYTGHTNPDDAPGKDDIARFLAEFHRTPLDEFVGNLQSKHGSAAARHLFEVTSSLDSMVLGEPQIVKQVKEAYELAGELDSCGLLHGLFQGATRVSSRVRTETKLSEGRVSIASVAVGDFAKGIFDRFDDKTVLVIGAGEMAEETLRYLTDEGARTLIVINRSRDRAIKLAEQWGGSVQPWDSLDHWLGLADVIVSTTGANEPIIDLSRFQAARVSSSDRPVFILDLGAPRDFATDVQQADDNVFLYDIDALEATCRENRKAREREVIRARKIIDEETEKYVQQLNHRSAGPIVQQLREGWHQVKEAELKRLFDRLPHLPEGDRQQVETAINRIVNKLLHPPMETLKAESRQGTDHGLVDALRQLFHLGE